MDSSEFYGLILIGFWLIVGAATLVADPLPYIKQGQCAGNYVQSGGYCVPKSSTTRQSIPKPSGQQCPAGWSSGASSCTK